MPTLAIAGPGAPADIPPGLVGRSVAEVMIDRPKTLPGGATIAEARAALLDGHVHVVLLVEGDVLVGTVERGDLTHAPDDGLARSYAVLVGRTVVPTTPAGEAWALLVAGGRRRLAVVDEQGALRGLLCLKRRRTGFCSNADVAARAADRTT